jgi:hypothetical protein
LAIKPLIKTSQHFLSYPLKLQVKITKIGSIFIDISAFVSKEEGNRPFALERVQEDNVNIELDAWYVVK